VAYGRVRDKEQYSVGGYYYQKTGSNPPTYSYNADHLLSNKTTADTVGAWNSVNPFLSEGFEWDTLPRISGKNVAGSTTREWFNYIPQGLYVVPNHLSTPTPPTDGQASITAAARSHPGRPRVSIPLYIAELRDLPRAVRMFGNLLDDFRAVRSNPNGHVARRRREELAAIRDASGYYLGIEFGFRPLLSDLRRLLHFQDEVAKTARDLDRLYSRGGLRRRRTVFSHTSSDGTNVSIQSGNVVISAHRQVVTTARKWVTMRWRPTDVEPLRTMVGQRSMRSRAQFARALALGQDGSLDTMLSTTWNALPWTWLADWFGNVGDYLQAHSNSVPCSPTMIAVMYSRETKASYSIRNISRPGVSCGGASGVRWSRGRVPGVLSPLPTIGIPFLSGRQMSILGALAATRHRFSGR